MESREIKETLACLVLVVCRDCGVHLALLPRVGLSTHAGGGPRVRVSREQSWSTVEGLQELTSPTKEGLPTVSACQTTHSTLLVMQLE